MPRLASATLGSPVVIQYEYGRSDSLPSPQWRSMTCVARAMISRVIDIGDALGQRPAGIAGKHAIEVLAVRRRVVDRAAEKGRHVGDVHQEDRAAQVRRIDRRAQPLQRDDRHVLGAVRAGDERQHRDPALLPRMTVNGIEAPASPPRGAISSVPETAVPGGALTVPMTSGA